MSKSRFCYCTEQNNNSVECYEYGRMAYLTIYDKYMAIPVPLCPQFRLYNIIQDGDEEIGEY